MKKKVLLIAAAAALTFGVGAIAAGTVLGHADIASTKAAVYTNVAACDFTAQVATTNTSYTNEWTYNTDWTVKGGSTNKAGWAYLRMGGKSTANGTEKALTGTIKNASAISDTVSQVVLAARNLTSGSGFTMNSIVLTVYSDSARTAANLVDTVDGGTVATAMTFSPSSTYGATAWASGLYYTFTFSSTSTTTTNRGMDLESLTFKKEVVSANTATGLAADPYEISPDYGANVKDELASVAITASVNGAAAAAYTNYSATLTRYDNSVVDVLDATTFKIGDKKITLTANDPKTSGGSEYATCTIDLTVAAPTMPVKVGKKYAIVAAHDSVNYELTGINASNLGTTTTYATDISANYPLTVANGAYEDTIAFKNSDNKYLAWSDGNTLTAVDTVTANSTWIVTGTLAEPVIRNVADDARVLYFNYNSGNTPRFVCYSSASTNYDTPAFVEIQDGIALTDFSIEATKDVYVGSTATIAVEYNPNNASDKTLTWTSSDEAVATVADGVVTGVAAGTATITASKVIGGVTVERTCTVTVNAAVPTHAGTAADPYTTQEAKDLALGVITGTKEGVYVKGIVTNSFESKSSNVAVGVCAWIGDDLTQTSAAKGGFELYKVSGWTSEKSAEILADLHVGSTVIATGDIIAYGTTPEMAEGCTVTYSSYANAIDFAEGFNAAFTTLCASTKDNVFGEAPQNVKDAMDAQATEYAKLDDLSKAHLVDATAKVSGNAVEKCVSTYDYVAKKYTGVTKFITGRTVSAASVASFSTEKTNVLPLAIIAATGLMATAGIFLVRRKNTGK